MRFTPLFLLTLTLAATAAPPSSLSLAEACARASESSPTLRRLHLRSQEALYRVDEAGVPGNTRASLYAGYSHLTPELNFGAYPLVVNDNYAAGVLVEQAIYTFGRLKWGREAARLEQESICQSERRESQRIVYQTSLLYSRLGTSKQEVEVAKQRVAAREALLHELQLRVQAGSSAPFEELVADVARAEDRQTLLQAEQHQAQLHDQLMVQLGLPVSSLVTVDDPPTPLAKPDAMLATALAQRPEMRALVLAYGAASARVSLEESQNAPELLAKTGFEQRTLTAFQTSNQWMVGLSLRLPLLDGGLSAARIGQAKAARDQIRESQLELERQITLELSLAQSHLRLSLEQQSLALSRLRSAQEARRIGELRFQAGLGTHQEVLDVQSHEAAAQLARLEAEQAVREALWELDWVMAESR